MPQWTPQKIRQKCSSSISQCQVKKGIIDKSPKEAWPLIHRPRHASFKAIVARDERSLAKVYIIKNTTTKGYFLGDLRLILYITIKMIGRRSSFSV